MNKIFASAIVLYFFGLPLMLCTIYKVFKIGSIGPMVPFSGLLFAITMPYLIYLTFVEFFQKHEIVALLVILSIPAGVLLAVLGVNIFIGMSHVFGIMDYQLM